MERADVDTWLDTAERSRSTDVRARLREGRELERITAEIGGEPVMRARLVVADALQRTGDTATAVVIADGVLAWARGTGSRSVRSRAHLLLCSVFGALGDPTAALDHAADALRHSDDDAGSARHGVLVLALANALALNGLIPQARARFEEAGTVFAALGDRMQELTVVNNLAAFEIEAGETEGIAHAARRLSAYAQDPAFCADFAETLARSRLLCGDVTGAHEAVALGEELLAAHGDSEVATSAELALTHAEVLLAEGRCDQAEEQLQESLDVCAARGLEALCVRALAVQAAVQAARGDFASAYLTQVRFHAEHQRLRSRRLESAAQARHTRFEAEEARREARRFWLQARTDPLTGLYNRRWLDEELPRRLGAPTGPGRAGPDRATGAGPGRAPWVVAVLDVDHFKQVNDRHGHDTGDAVLRGLAGLLRRAVGAPGRLRPGQLHGPAGDATAGPAEGDGGFAARLGGEEFLVGVVGDDPAEALARCEGLRAAVETYPWHRIAEGLSVTVSLGVAVVRDGDGQRSLVSRADRHLYEAKETGRNRVVADP